MTAHAQQVMLQANMRQTTAGTITDTLLPLQCTKDHYKNSRSLTMLHNFNKTSDPTNRPITAKLCTSEIHNHNINKLLTSDIYPQKFLPDDKQQTALHTAMYRNVTDLYNANKQMQTVTNGGPMIVFSESQFNIPYSRQHIAVMAAANNAR